MNHPPGAPALVSFGVYRLDLEAGELFRNGRKLKLRGQPFQVLAALLERPGEVVTRDELRAKLWPSGTFVDFDRGLNRAVNEVRDALGDSATNPRFVETLSKRGYRFIAPVQHGEQPLPAREEATPPQPVFSSGGRGRSWKFALAALVLLAASFTVFRLAGWPSRLARGPAHQAIQSLAVLPLQNLSGDPTEDYFADGMTDELITELAKLRSLRVISRTSSSRYKGSRKPLAAISQELHVDAVIEGSVVRAGERVRITAQLIRTATDEHIWADSYERSLADVVSIQGQVAQEIARQVHIQLTPLQQGSFRHLRPLNPQAHDAYLRGRYFWNLKTEDGLNRGIQYFSQAIATDPAYAQAYAGLADSYIVLGILGFEPSNKVYPEAKTAALKALALDDSLAEAHASLADVLKGYEWNWDAAGREYRRAIDLDPNYSVVHQWNANYLSILGRHAEAIAEAQRARDLDPVSPTINAFVSLTYLRARRYDEAVSEGAKALDFGPRLPLGHWFLGQAYLARADNSLAIDQLRQAVTLSGGSGAYNAALGYAYAAAGSRTEALAVLREMMNPSRHRYVSPVDIAIVYTGLGDGRSAIEWLEKAYRERTMRLTELAMPIFDRLRPDPRFRALAGHIGLPL